MERWRVLAGKQFGVVSRGQLCDLGLTDEAIRWRLDKGQLEEIFAGTYRIAGTPASWFQSLMALCLWAGPGAVVSHRAAAALWGLDDFREGPLEISAPKKNQLRSRFKVHRTHIPERQTTGVKGIPVTNPTRTVFDLAEVLDQERFDCVLDEALRRGLTSLEALRRLVDQNPRRPGSGKVRRALDERGPGYQPSASRLQFKVRRLLEKAGFTGFVEEMDLYDSDGVFLGRPDFVFPAEGVLVEAESRKHHSNKKDFRNDIERRNRLTAEHYLMIQVTWEHLRDPTEVIERIRRALKDQPLRRT